MRRGVGARCVRAPVPAAKIRGLEDRRQHRAPVPGAAAARTHRRREIRGFDGVELLFPYDLDAHAVRREALAQAMPIVQLNSPGGDRMAGEAGFAAVPGRESQFRQSIQVAFDFLKACGSSQLHVLAGIPAQGADAKLVRATYVRNLQWVADEAAASGTRIMIEPLNSRDMRLRAFNACPGG